MSDLEQEKWDYLLALDDELLKGGVIIGAKASALIQNSDIAYCAGAPVAAIVLAVAAMESHLREEFGLDDAKGFRDVIDGTDFDLAVKSDLHDLRRERNRWVHARDDGDNDDWLHNDIAGADGLEPFARKAVRLLRIVVYDNPWV